MILLQKCWKFLIGLLVISSFPISYELRVRNMLLEFVPCWLLPLLKRVQNERVNKRTGDPLRVCSPDCQWHLYYDGWELSYNAALEETSRCLRWDFGKEASWPWNCSCRSSIQLRRGSTNSFWSFKQFSNCSRSVNSSSIVSTVRARTTHRSLLIVIS